MTCSFDFDWDDVADDVVVPEQAAIAVYTNPKGEVVVRQAGHHGPDEDSWIIVAPDRASAVADAILRAARLHDNQPVSGEAASPKDRTAAERQRRYRERNRNGTDRDPSDRHVTNRDDEQPLLLENFSGQAGGV